MPFDLASCIVYTGVFAAFLISAVICHKASRPEKGTTEWITDVSSPKIPANGSAYELGARDLLKASLFFAAAFILKLLSSAAAYDGLGLGALFSGLDVIPAYIADLWSGDSITPFLGLFAYGGIAVLVYVFSKTMTGSAPSSALAASLFILSTFGNARLRQYTSEYLELSLAVTVFISFLSYYLFYRGITMPAESGRVEAYVYFLTSFLLCGFGTASRPSAVIFTLLILPALAFHIHDISDEYLKSHSSGKLVLYGLLLFVSYALFSLLLPELMRRLTWDYSQNSVYTGIADLFSFFAPASSSYMLFGAVSFSPFSVAASLFGAVYLICVMLRGKNPVCVYLLLGLVFVYVPYAFSLATGTESLIASAVALTGLSPSFTAVFSKGAPAAKAALPVLLILAAAACTANYFAASGLL